MYKRDIHKRLVDCLSFTKEAQPVAFGVSLNLNLQSQSPWSLFNRTWKKRHEELDHRLRFENEETTLQMQQAVLDLYTNLSKKCIFKEKLSKVSVLLNWPRGITRKPTHTHTPTPTHTRSHTQTHTQTHTHTHTHTCTRDVYTHW